MNQFHFKSFLVYLITIFCIFLGTIPTTTSAKDNSDLSSTYIHAGMGFSLFGPSFQVGAHYRPGQYSLNFRYLSSFSDEDGFVGSSNSHLSVIYSRVYTIQPFSIEGGLGVSAVFISARPDTYSGGISLGSRVDEPEMAAFTINFQPVSNETKLTAGIPIEIQLAWNITSRFVWAIHTFANLNTISANAGAFTTLQWRLPRQ